MKSPEDKTSHFFVDEAGDPIFYGKGKSVIVGKEGCSRVFSLAFLETNNPQPIRDALGDLRAAISTDKYLAHIPSLSRSLNAFHATDDTPEIRMLVYKTLASLDFTAQIIVARKREPMFRTKYQSSQDLFYDDLVTKLFKNRLHLVNHHIITFSRRGKKARQHALRAAIDRAAEKFRAEWKTETKTNIRVDTNQAIQEPVLQAVDYVIWTVQRAYERGEMRYFEFLRDKISLVCDVFDNQQYKGARNFYTRDRNPFDVKKISPLG
jgi:hypothetical protein